MVFWILLGVVAAVVLLTVLVNGILALLQLRYVAGIAPVQYKNQLQPQPLDGRWVFTTDRDFRVMQLTDVHIGGGWMSFFKDRRAIDCVVRMVTAEQPDLVAVTGDIAYPVPFQSGTFNNKTAARLFGRVMQNLGVYWRRCWVTTIQSPTRCTTAAISANIIKNRSSPKPAASLLPVLLRAGGRGRRGQLYRGGGEPSWRRDPGTVFYRYRQLCGRRLPGLYVEV